MNESGQSILVAAEGGSMEQGDLAEVRLGLAQEPGKSKVVFSPFPDYFARTGTRTAFRPEQVRSAEHDSQSARSVAPSHLRNLSKRPRPSNPPRWYSPEHAAAYTVVHPSDAPISA